MRSHYLLMLLIGGLTAAHHSRRKRYLNFPNKAVVVLTMSLLKGIANDIKVAPTIKVLTIHELDLLFPLPHDPSPFELSQTALGSPPAFHLTHSRQKRDLYRQLEDLIYIQGLEGRTCVLKALCEAKEAKPKNEENLALDLLSILFSYPQNVTNEIEDEYKVTKYDCKRYKRMCTFSIFDAVIDWAHHFSVSYND